MTQPHIPAHDADSARDAETASAPSYPQRSTAQDHSATQELPAAQDATREMPSATTIPAPPVGTVPPASAQAAPAAPAAPSAQETPASSGAYSAPSGQPYSGYAAPASPDAFASPTVIVTKKGPGWVAPLGAMLLPIGLTLGAVFYARPALLRASTPTNLNGGTVATVPVSNSSGTDWTDVAAAVSPAVVTIQAQGASSGGPLFDASGAVIGINSSIKSLATSSDGQAGSIGLGFAIPSDLVVSIADQLIASGSASHGMLGVTVKAATTTVGSDTYVGAEVQDVSAGSGASAAGIRAGDVIVKVEGQEVTSPKQLIGYVRRYKAGDTVTMTIVRDGATQDVSVRIQ